MEFRIEPRRKGSNRRCGKRNRLLTEGWARTQTLSDPGAFKAVLMNMSAGFQDRSNLDPLYVQAPEHAAFLVHMGKVGLGEIVGIGVFGFAPVPKLDVAEAGGL